METVFVGSPADQELAAAEPRKVAADSKQLAKKAKSKAKRKAR